MITMKRQLIKILDLAEVTVKSQKILDSSIILGEMNLKQTQEFIDTLWQELDNFKL